MYEKTLISIPADTLTKTIPDLCRLTREASPKNTGLEMLIGFLETTAYTLRKYNEGKITAADAVDALNEETIHLAEDVPLTPYLDQPPKM